MELVFAIVVITLIVTTFVATFRVIIEMFTYIVMVVVELVVLEVIYKLSIACECEFEELCIEFQYFLDTRTAVLQFGHLKDRIFLHTAKPLELAKGI